MEAEEFFYFSFAFSLLFLCFSTLDSSEFYHKIFIINSINFKNIQRFLGLVTKAQHVIQNRRFKETNITSR